MAEASSSAPATGTPRLSFTDEESATFSAEIDRLQEISLICKVSGSRPNRGELRDMLQGQLLAVAGKVEDIQPLGKGYYQIEFDSAERAATVLARSPLTIRSARVHFCSWRHGFDPATDPLAEAAGFPVSICFPGLRKEYRPFLERIGSLFGTVVETPQTAASVVAKAAGIPSIRVFIPAVTGLPAEISLPLLGGGWITQRVEFSGLPNQCFICRREGHLARACPRRRPRAARPRTQPDTARPATADPPPAPPGDPSEGQPEGDGWQRVPPRRQRGPARPTPQWVPTGNRFDILQETEEAMDIPGDTSATDPPPAPPAEGAQLDPPVASPLSPPPIPPSEPPPPPPVSPTVTSPTPPPSPAHSADFPSHTPEMRRRTPAFTASRVSRSLGLGQVTRPELQIRTSPFSAVPVLQCGLPSRTVGTFGYAFTRYFDDQGAITEPSVESQV